MIEPYIDFNGLDVYHQIRVENNRVLVTIENYEDDPIECTVTIRNGPEKKRKRKGKVKRESLFSLPLYRTINRLIIIVECE